MSGNETQSYCLAGHMRRNARLMERLYTDEAIAQADRLNAAAGEAEHWAKALKESTRA